MKPTSAITQTLRGLSGRALALAALAHLASHSAQAATIYWDGPNAGWDAVASWSTAVGATTPNPGAIPGAADVANFSISTVNSATTVSLNGNQSALGLIFLGTNTAATTLQGGGTNRSLTLGANGITVNYPAGAVTIGSTTANQNVAVTLNTAQTWTNNSPNALTLNHAVTNGANLLTVAGTGNTALNGILGGGAGGLTKNGAGALTLTAANTYTGLTTISGGTLNLGNGTTGSLNGTTGTDLTFSNSGTFNAREAANSTQGMGMLTFGAGDDTVTSTFATGAVSATLTVADVAARPASGGTGNFTLGGGDATTNMIVLTNFNGSAPGAGTLLDKGLFFAGSSYAAYDATGYLRAYATTDSNAATADAGASTIADVATNHVFVTGTVNAQEAAVVNTINLAANALTLSAPDTLLQTNGLLATGGSISGGILQPSVAGGELVARINSGTTTLSSAIQNNTSASSLTKSGGGTLTLSGVNTYTGATTVNGGILQFTTKDALYNNTPESWTDSNLVVARGATLVFNVGGAGEFTGTDIGNLVALGTASGGFRDGSRLGLSTASGDVTYATAIANPNGGTNMLGLTKLDANTLTLSATNTYSGPTTVSGGTLKLAGGTGTVLDNATTITLAGSSLDLNDQSETVTSLVVSGNSVLSSTGTGSGALTTTTPSATNGIAPSILTGGTLTFNSGTLTSPAYFVINGTLTMGGGSIVTSNEFLNGFNNNGAVVNLNSGSLNTGSMSFGNFASAYYLNGGTVETGQFKRRSTANVDLFFNGVTVKTKTGTAANVADKFLPGNGSGTGPFTAGQNAWISTNGVTFNSNNISTTVAGPLQHDTLGAATDGGLTKTGAGTLTLSGANTYNGLTTVNAGTLTLSASGSLNAASSVSIAAGATLDVSAYATYTLGASASLAASGTGTTVGTSAAAIKGATTVSLGSRPITLTYDGTNPALYVSQGTLSLNGNAFTVNKATPLADGTYTIVRQASGNITTAGSSPDATGTAIGSGKTGTITVSGNSVTLTVAPAVVVGMDHFAISEISSPQTAGTPITGITLTAQDAGNATVTGFTGTVTFGGSAGITGTSASFTDGVLTDVSVTPTVAGGDLTFTVDDGFTHTGTTTLTTIQPGAPNKLAFTTAPGGGAAGTAWTTQPVVTVQDTHGNTVTGSSASITLAIKSGTGPGTLSGTKTVSATDSVATFSDLSIDKTGAGYQLSATSDGLTGADSPAFSITAGNASTLTVSGFPSSQPTGQSAGVTVTAWDVYGNIATGYTGTVSLTSSSDPLAAFAPNPYTFLAPDNGVKTLTATLKTIGTQSITATDTVTGTITGTQSGIAVTATPPISTFTTPGTTTWTAPAGVTSVQLLVVGGGGGAGTGGAAGGGGAGGLLYYGSEAGAVASSYTVTPGTTYNITVGAGGATQTNGGNSTFDSVTAVGGGAGGSQFGAGAAGGSGGGSDVAPWGSLAGGAGTAGQGYAGGASQGGGQAESAGGGGGGAGMVGYAGHNLPATGNKGQPGNGGDGLTFSISGAAVTYAGGGGGAFFGDAPYTGLIQGVGGAGYLNAGGGGTAVYPTGSTPGQNGIVIATFSASSSPFGDWIGGFSGVPSGQTGFNDDPNNDGVANGLAWILLGGAPLANSLACLPVPATSAGAVTLEFTCLKPGELGDAIFEVQYSNDLGVGDPWHSAAVPASSTTVNTVVFTVSEYDATHNHVIAEIPQSAAAGGKLFSRLVAILP